MSTEAMKHTKGKWERAGFYIRGPFAIGDADEPGLLIATVASSGPEAAANGDLIAAAPELLSLLQDAVASFGPDIEGGDDEWLTAARAAIAKATGGAA